MKLRVRINNRTSRVELPSEEATLKELSDLIQQTLLSYHGLSANTDFSLSLNGSETLSDSSQTLASCGIVSGDLICVLLPRCPEVAIATSGMTSTTNTTTQSQQASSQLRPAALTSALQDCKPDSEPAAPVWEPMLCSEAEEGQAPLSLELLLHSTQITSPNDAIIVAAHLLMLETGFTPEGSELKPEEVPVGWRSAAGVYKLQYTHPLCGNSQASMVAVSMSTLLVINMTLKVTEVIDTVRKLQLNASSYVTDEWPGGSAAATFRNLKKLSRVFKDQLAYPLIAAAREAMALPVAFGLPALPPELLLRVLRLLDVRSVVRLSAVNRHFNIAASDSMLWRHLYIRDFSNAGGSSSSNKHWKECQVSLAASMTRDRTSPMAFCPALAMTLLAQC